MKTKKITLALLALMLVVMVGLVAVACNKDTTPSYTVTLDARTGEATSSLSAKSGETVTLPTPTVDGATFLGWFTEKDGQGTQWTNETPVVADIILYAAWEAAQGTKQIVLTLDLNGAVIEEDGVEITSLTVDIIPGVAYTLPANPERKCYDFAGWFSKKVGGTQLNPDDAISKDTTYYAQWNLKEDHTHDYALIATVEPTCEKEGYQYHYCECGEKKNEKINKTAALGHIFNFDNVKFNGEDDYFEMVVCAREDCDKAARRESDREFDDAFTFTYNTEDGVFQTTIDAHVDALVDVLDPESDNFVGVYDEALHGWAKPSDLYDENKEFEHTYYDVFYDDLEYITEQYQVCYVYYCVNDQNAEWKEKYEAIQDARTKLIEVYYSLFQKVYDTKFRNFFFSEEDGWTPEEIEKALTLSATYGGGEYAEIKSGIDEIEVAFRDLDTSVVKDQTGSKFLVVPNMYEKYVALNNRLAQLSGYDNYVEYAYKNVYDRDYSPEDVAQLRTYAKQYFVDVYKLIENLNSKNVSFNKEQQKYFNALSSDSIFDSKLTSDFVGSYLKEMNIKDEESVVQSYYETVNELFRVGNYFPGKYSGAFNYWIEAQQKSVLYFGPGSYSGAFTFIHEFGHYNNSYYNHGTSMSFDLDETHSQGNEMMFLAYLKNVLPSGMDKVYNKVEINQLSDMIRITIIAMAVDEFEQAVYTNTYTGSKYEDGITPNEYDSLFQDILASYGATNLNSAYWRYVVIESACYYISYSTSAMASLQMYVWAMKDLEENGNLDATREKYYKLITFTDDENNAHTDFVGDKVVDIGFAETLHYAGLYSPFDEDLYKFVSEYLNEQLG